MRGTAIAIAAGACLLLAGCDQGSKSDNVSIKGKDGTVTISANGRNFTMKAADGQSGSFSMSGDNGHFTMHASDGKQTVDINASGNAHVDTPDFVSLYPGAKVRSTSIGASASGSGGTIMFETADSPAAVIAWYKRKAADAGLKRAIDMTMGPTSMFSANAQDGKKTFQVVAASSGGGARVQLNWSGK